MKVGTAQVDITPQPGIDLAGFALRPQPSTSVLDPLWVRALYLEDGPERFLWLHADLLALEQPLADRSRRWVGAELGIPLSRVLVSTTHTHSAPATIRLTGCGEVDAAYVTWLEKQCRRAVRSALHDTEPCQLVAAQGRCSLGVDRRDFASAHIDPRVGALGWRRHDGSFKAVFLNYAMHPVCLRDHQVSGDWPGEAARVLSDALPGRPVALVSPGACANIDPPAVGVTPQQMSRWGRQVAESVLEGLLAARHGTPLPEEGSLKMTATTVMLPLETWNADQVEKYAGSCLAAPAGPREFGDSFRLAVETWRATMIERLRRCEPPYVRVELGMVSFVQAAILTVNAEMFSRFTELAGSDANCPVYTVSCANGMIGYVPSAEAYDEGAYEVSWAMLFYNMPRPRKGGLELLARHARRLIAASGQEASTADSRPLTTAAGVAATTDVPETIARSGQSAQP